MADLSLVTADTVSVVESIMQETLPAGEAISAGEVVTFNASTGKWALADANVTEGDPPLYVATKTVSAGVGLTAIKKGVIDGYDLSGLDYGAPVFLSATAGAIATSIVPTNEVQSIDITGSPTGGTFKLSFRGEETGAIAHDADNAAIELELEALSTVGAGNGTVSGTTPNFAVAFSGPLAGENLPLIELTDNSLTGGSSPDVDITADTEGVPQRIVGHVLPAASTPLGTAYDKLLLVDC